MPWSNQGGGFGGGGGGGGRGPWGQGSGGGRGNGGGGNGGGPFGGPNPPSLEDILRKGQDRFRGMLPGGDVSGRGILLLILVAVAIWLGTGFYRVTLGERLAECSCQCPDSRHRQDAAQVPCKHTLAALAARRMEREATWHQMDDAAAWAAIA